jgi:hypothetical protein
MRRELACFLVPCFELSSQNSYFILKTLQLSFTILQLRLKAHHIPFMNSSLGIPIPLTIRWAKESSAGVTSFRISSISRLRVLSFPSKPLPAREAKGPCERQIGQGNGKY